MPAQDCFSITLGPQYFKNEIETPKAYFNLHRKASYISLEPDLFTSDLIARVITKGRNILGIRVDFKRTMASCNRELIESMYKALKM